MKTAVEWTIDDRALLGVNINRIKKLLKFSKLAPWFLDSRVKFEHFYLCSYGNYNFYIRGYLKDTIKIKEILVNLENYKERELMDPVSFMRQIEIDFNFQPGWMTFEDSL